MKQREKEREREGVSSNEAMLFKLISKRTNKGISALTTHIF